MRRILFTSILALGAACTTYRGTGQDNVTFIVPAAPDSALRLASAQLQQHGYTVSTYGTRTVVTQPREVPLDPKSPSARKTPQYYVVRVDTDIAPLSNQTKLRAAAFFLPSVSADTATATRAIPVTDQSATVFGELHRLQDWMRQAMRGR
ncbi:MAG: hypothetical protein M3068_06390 [Gemmatimonadota bacterium]|nr:hypothetical protein [Gemmatimonadota bacterium]